MSYPAAGADERPDPLHDQHVSFPDAPATHPAGPSLPDSAWAPTARTSPVGGAPPSGPPTTAPPGPPPGWVPGRRAPSPPRRRRVLGAIVVVWICFGAFGNHGSDSHGPGDSGRSGHGPGYNMGSGSGEPGLLTDGHDPAAVLPVATGVGVVPSGVQQFRVEVASTADVTVTRSTQRGSDEPVVADSWAGDVTPEAGYPAPVGPTGQQSSKGPVGPTVSGIVTATTTASERTSTVQCRVYADDVLVLMSTGPGTVTCRVPAVDGAAG